MREIIFAKTRWDYQSYTDYWTLVELSGFPTCYVDEIDLDRDAVYIVCPMNGEIYDRFANEPVTLNRKARMMMWNLERPGDDSVQQYAQGNKKLQKYFQKILISDKALAHKCADIANSDVFAYVTLGVHEGLGYPGSFEDKRYDLIHLACYSLARSSLFDTPSSPKRVYDECSVAPNGWGLERIMYLKESRFMLNVHQDRHKFMEPLRFALAAMYGLPIITDYCIDSSPYPSYALNVGNPRKYVKTYTRLTYDIGLMFRQYMIEHFQFSACVKAAVYRFEHDWE